MMIVQHKTFPSRFKGIDQITDCLAPENEGALLFLGPLDGRAHRFPESQLHKVLDLSIDGPMNGILKERFHFTHECLKAFDHRNNLNQGKLLFSTVVEASRFLILLSFFYFL